MRWPKAKYKRERLRDYARGGEKNPRMLRTSYVDAPSLGRELKEKGCDYVIALTHMRTQNDVRSEFGRARLKGGPQVE